ncbi:unnamed protein product [Rotaria sp. Silwood2]|nr:unnamed protein product [Rotaria sp. Silwood2]CAF2669973.1 unnamed protein product [Rotaria sp. Silwood2]CAF2946917.1 unnamed protein product [Rotaria sp. Silwood2]CAF3104264.1 unnamed protein product [Rotaria sp. Silwood2]CAF3971301.1 unnamed protein product [Rotaria sp. Silwood2]
MGSINSRPIHENNYSNNLHRKHYNRFLSLSCLQSLLSSFNHRSSDNDFHRFNNKQRSCSKKKVLILGLDGVGKTELFTQLIRHDKKKLKIDSLPRPTIGYNVETIKLRCHHLCHRRYHKITLWDCGGQSSVRSLWSYHYSNTSLLLWLINIHDRSRLDANLHLLSQILTNPTLHRVPVLIVLYNSSFDQNNQEKSNENTAQDLLTNLEISFRFLAALPTSRASTCKWQVIDVTLDENNSQRDLKKIRQSFRELMEL